ncbi:MAG TPA: GNAT family N-acetyltransferase [Nocardioides sp.]|nr:GNAT family N-acetyltransferase [Nocardioides sp.]
MSDSGARVLSEADWQAYRDLRLEALRESPDSFAASYDEESQHDEQFWRERMRGARRLMAERNGEAVGLVGLGIHDQDPEIGEILGLWVAPEARRSRVAWDLLWAVAKQAYADGRRQLYFWVGSDNGPAVAFASTFGFRPTSERRLVPAASEVDGSDEVAMVLPLSADPTSVFNPRLP